MRETPDENRSLIAFFGQTNRVKSSLLNRATNQGLSLVSDETRTIIDCINKAIERFRYGQGLLSDTLKIIDYFSLREIMYKLTGKGIRKISLAGLVLNAVKPLKNGIKVVISEGCKHRWQEDAIERVKIPCWLKQNIVNGKSFEWSSGMSFLKDLTFYALVIRHEACMLQRREIFYQTSEIGRNGVRVLTSFPEVFKVYLEGRGFEC